MKIYNKIVWDREGNVIEEDSYEYEGPIGLAKGNPPTPQPPPPPPPPPPTVQREQSPTRTRALGSMAGRKRARGRGALVTKRGTSLGVETAATGEQKSLIGVIKYIGDKLGVQ